MSALKCRRSSVGAQVSALKCHAFKCLLTIRPSSSCDRGVSRPHPGTWSRLGRGVSRALDQTCRSCRVSAGGWTCLTYTNTHSSQHVGKIAVCAALVVVLVARPSIDVGWGYTVYNSNNNSTVKYCCIWTYSPILLDYKIKYHTASLNIQFNTAGFEHTV